MILLMNIYFLSILLIIFPFVIYPLSLKLISLFYKEESLRDISDDELPSVSLIITAYNEEKVIKRKLDEAVRYKYPADKYEIIVASDDSNDSTHSIVENFIDEIGKNFPSVRLFIVKGRKGKTVVQNQAVKIAKGEIVAFSDANSVWNNNALWLMARRFINPRLGYICGRLQYVNTDKDMTSRAEGLYWNFDLKIRKLESKIGSIVGGNGAIYAIRKSLYVDLPPLFSHDGFMPTKMVVQGATAKYEPEAIAFEKASQNPDDEFQRKIRMQRGQPWKKYTDIEKFNIFKYGWFSYFYFGHKYVKYILYLLHPLLYISNIFLANSHIFFIITLIGQTVFYLMAMIGYLTRNKKRVRLFYYPYHYCLTIVAQIYSIINTLKGNAKATWEKSETTRV
jgi:cellulose synthase/poly-beta-1,6-N-acetylglucosamine synthase-like glycosyltransferase